MKKIRIVVSIIVLCVMLIGCSKKDSGTIRIASKPMTEQYILTEILKILIEEKTNLVVEITKGVGGGTTNIHPALMNGEFDLYPEYTGTAWMSVLKKSEVPDEKTLLKNLRKEYEDMGLVFSPLYGFNNSYTLIVRTEIAKKYDLKTYSDVAKSASEMIFGGNYDYIEREDGYPLLCSTYQMQFKETIDMDIALKYQALEEKQIDITNAFTTDAMLSVAEVTVLADDKNFFTTYYCGTVIRKEVLEKYPSLQKVLDKMNNLITDEEMQDMNYAVEVLEKDEAEVAAEFLAGKK